MPNPRDIPGPEPAPRGLERLKSEGKTQHPAIVRSVDDALRLGEIFVRSGFFKDSRAVSQAVVKILYGLELGLGPMAAMTGIDVVEGRVTPGANLTASMLEEHPDYDYRVDERSSERCTITFLRRDPETRALLERGAITWTLEDAGRAGLLKPNNPKAAWTAYPRAMLYARAMTEGARTYCPNLFSGITAYSAEELGVDWTTEDVQAAEAAAAEAAAVAGEPEPATDAAEEGEVLEPAAGDDGEPPEDPPSAPATPAEPEPSDDGGTSESPSTAPVAPEVQEDGPTAQAPEAPAEAPPEPESDAAAEEAWAASAQAPAKPAEVAPAEPETTTHVRNPDGSWSTDRASAAPAPRGHRRPTPAESDSLLAQTRLAGLMALGVPGPRVRELREAFNAGDVSALADDDTYHLLAEAVRSEAAAVAVGGGEPSDED